jgi:NADPH-dependent ferric siderophore reductase
VSQISIFGQHHVLAPMRAQWSEIVHAAAVDVLGLPPDKRFHRFFPMDPEDFPTPPGRSERYTIVELRLFTGRTVATKKVFYARIYADAAEHLGISSVDLEIAMVETPRHDWAIRGLPGDELALTYEVQR